jgi:hypothetical protein
VSVFALARAIQVSSLAGRIRRTLLLQSAQLWNSKCRWCDHYRVFSFGDDTRHSHVDFIDRSQMIQRSTKYPIKMATLVICQVSLLAMLVRMFR